MPRTVTKYRCDVCLEATFGTYLEAEEHEERCRQRRQEQAAGGAGGSDGVTDASLSSRRSAPDAGAQGHGSHPLPLNDGSAARSPSHARVVSREEAEDDASEKSGWECDVCKDAFFVTYEEAVAHESECSGKKSRRCGCAIFGCGNGTKPGRNICDSHIISSGSDQCSAGGERKDGFSIAAASHPAASGASKPRAAGFGSSSQHDAVTNNEGHDACTKAGERRDAVDRRSIPFVGPKNACRWTEDEHREKHTGKHDHGAGWGHDGLVVQHHYNDHAADPTVDPSLIEHKAKGGVITPFPAKLHDMLDKTEADGLAHVVSWQPHGRCFVVHKPKEFVDRVMPRYFKQTKMDSFRRQLNLYGFNRLTSGLDKGGYYHEMFLRGKVSLAYDIHRARIKGTGVRLAANPDNEPNFYVLPPVNDVSPDEEGNTLQGSARRNRKAEEIKAGGHLSNKSSVDEGTGNVAVEQRGRRICNSLGGDAMPSHANLAPVRKEPGTSQSMQQYPLQYLGTHPTTRSRGPVPLLPPVPGNDQSWPLPSQMHPPNVTDELADNSGKRMCNGRARAVCSRQGCRKYAQRHRLCVRHGGVKVSHPLNHTLLRGGLCSRHLNEDSPSDNCSTDYASTSPKPDGARTKQTNNTPLSNPKVVPAGVEFMTATNQGTIARLPVAFGFWLDDGGTSKELAENATRQFTANGTLFDDPSLEAVQPRKKVRRNTATPQSDPKVAVASEEVKVTGSITDSLAKLPVAFGFWLDDIASKKVAQAAAEEWTRTGSGSKARGECSSAVAEEAATGKSNKANASNTTTATATTATGITAVAATPPTPSFAIMVPGANGAVGATHLKGTVFVLNGAFEEVHLHMPTAQQQLQRMIESFGGRVLQRMSKNMTHLLAGKDAEGNKIEDAQKKGAKIVNLRRLQKLLLGQLTFESMDQLDKLTKANFRGDAYEPAGAPPPPAPTTTVGRQGCERTRWKGRLCSRHFNEASSA